MVGRRGRDTHDVARRSDFPVLVAPLCETLYDVRLVPHQSEQAHDLLAAPPDAAQHVALLCVLENEHELVDAVDFIFDALNERAESVGDVVDKGVRYPVGGDGDVVFKLLNSAADVVWMWGWLKVELDDDS